MCRGFHYFHTQSTGVGEFDRDVTPSVLGLNYVRHVDIIGWRFHLKCSTNGWGFHMKCCYYLVGLSYIFTSVICESLYVAGGGGQQISSINSTIITITSTSPFQ